MKKFGFTLAEVLITLAIIGVVSALVLPTFTASTQRSKIGPKLAKAVSVFEQATQAVLNDAESDSISGAQVECRQGATLSPLTGCFYSQLEHHLKGAANGNEGFTSADGVTYTGSIGSITEQEFAHETVATDRLVININPNASSDVDGGNIFYFELMDDGSLRPWGSSRGAAANVWTTRCPGGDRTVSSENRPYCTGHVMENGLKVEYKL